MKQISFLYLTLLAFLVDAGAFAASQVAMPWLVSKMENLGGRSALVLVGAFLLFIAGVYVIRRMAITDHGVAERPSRPWRTVLAVVFAGAIGLGIALQLGFVASSVQADTTQLGEGGSASYFVLGPGAMIAFSMIYVLILAFPVNPSIKPDGIGYALAALFGLVATDLMLLVYAAHVRALLPESGLGWWVALLAFLWLVLLFGPPRMLFVTRTVGLPTPMAYAIFVVFLMVLGVFAAQMVVTDFSPLDFRLPQLVLFNGVSGADGGSLL